MSRARRCFCARSASAIYPGKPQLRTDRGSMEVIYKAAERKVATSIRTVGTAAGIAMLLMAAPAAANEMDEKKCEIQPRLNEIYAEYAQLEANPPVSALVKLDGELREILPDPNPDNFPWSPFSCWKPEFEEIGVVQGHFCQCTRYHGTLLARAHSIEPNSALRSYTLYSEGARRYLKEFTEGPFASSAHRTIGGFYSDLFLFIRDEVAGDQKSYKQDCFVEFIDERPAAEQLSEAQRKAVFHFSEAARLDPTDKIVRRWLRYMEAGDPQFHHTCAD